MIVFIFDVMDVADLQEDTSTWGVYATFDGAITGALKKIREHVKPLADDVDDDMKIYERELRDDIRVTINTLVYSIIQWDVIE